jgi:hypothetical protein
MATQLYPQGKNHLLGKTTQIDLDSDTIKAMLVDNSTTVYNSAHEFVSSLAGGGIVARSGALTSPTLTAGLFDAADILLPAVAGPNIQAIIVYKDSGSDASSPLIAWMDITPFGPTGGDITIVWNASGIFTI